MVFARITFMVPKCNKIKRRERYHWDHRRPVFEVASFNNGEILKDLLRILGFLLY